MKTNMMMQIKIGIHTLPIGHLDMMGSLTDLWNIGNSYRTAKGLKPLDMKNYARSPETIEFINILNEKFKCVENTHLKNVSIDSEGLPIFIKTKKGRHGGGTWAHLYILLDAASRLDAEFKFLIMEAFVTNKILQWRDDSGDNFIALNAAIDAYLPDRKDKSNMGLFIQCAILLKDKIKPDGNTWNTANYQQLKLRTNYEARLVDYLKMGMVRDWEHLKELIHKL